MSSYEALFSIFSFVAHNIFCSFACRRILAPGEEENLEFEEDEEEGGAGAGSPDSFPARVPGGYPLFKNILLTLVQGQMFGIYFGSCQWGVKPPQNPCQS